MRDVIVVTGAGGLLGSRVVPLLRRSAPRAHLIAVVRGERVAPGFGTGVEMIGGDLRLAKTWRRLPAAVTHVIHLAARIPWDPRHAQRASVVTDNLAPIAHLLAASRAWPDLRQVVLGSSVSVYGPSRDRLAESSPTRPTTVYGAAKLAGEHLVGVLRQRGVAVASLRFSSLYGAGQFQGTVLPLLAARARAGLTLELFNAGRVQDFLHVDDAAHATWLACRHRARGVFNIGAGRSVSMLALARAILRHFNTRGMSRIVEVDTDSAHDPGTRLNIGRARRELLFRPRVGLDAGLRRLARERAVAGRARRS